MLYKTPSNKFEIYLFVMLTCLIVGCSFNREILYRFPNNTSIEFKKSISQFSSLLKLSENERLYAVCLDEANGSLITFNQISTAHPDIKLLVRNSNRYLIIENSKIPVIFSNDFWGLKEPKIPYVMSNGVWLRINNKGEITSTGISY